MMKIKRTTELTPRLTVQQQSSLMKAMALYDPSYNMRRGVHDGLFQSTVLGQSTPEQLKKWEEDVKQKRILGCFAMVRNGRNSRKN
jgi:hypothetical protein